MTDTDTNIDKILTQINEQLDYTKLPYILEMNVAHEDVDKIAEIVGENGGKVINTTEYQNYTKIQFKSEYTEE